MTSDQKKLCRSLYFRAGRGDCRDLEFGGGGTMVRWFIIVDVAYNK